MVKAAVKIKYNKYLGIGRVNMIRQNFRNIFNKNKKKPLPTFFSLKLLGEKRAKANAAAEAAGRRRASDDFLAAGS
jgi:hypothetical protein